MSLRPLTHGARRGWEGIGCHDCVVCSRAGAARLRTTQPWHRAPCDFGRILLLMRGGRFRSKALGCKGLGEKQARVMSVKSLTHGDRPRATSKGARPNDVGQVCPTYPLTRFRADSLTHGMRAILIEGLVMKWVSRKSGARHECKIAYSWPAVSDVEGRAPALRWAAGQRLPARRPGRPMPGTYARATCRRPGAPGPRGRRNQVNVPMFFRRGVASRGGGGHNAGLRGSRDGPDEDGRGQHERPASEARGLILRPPRKPPPREVFRFH